MTSPFLLPLLLSLAVPLASQTQVSVHIVALGDGGHVYVGQPAYVDVSFGNSTSTDLKAGNAALEIWEIQPPGSPARACESGNKLSFESIQGADSGAPWLRPGEERVVRGNVVQQVCLGSLDRAGNWRLRAGLKLSQQGSAFSEWKVINVVEPTGKEADAIRLFPRGVSDPSDYLKRYGDTAVAARLLRSQNEKEARGHWVEGRPLAQIAEHAAQSPKWLEGAKTWRMGMTESLLRQHPKSYFAGDLQTALAAMYAATGNVENLERLGSGVQKTSPESGAEMRNLASALKAQKGVSR